MLEKQSGEEILVGRNEGVPKFLSLIGKWNTKRGFMVQVTVPYCSSQNGLAKIAIQTSER